MNINERNKKFEENFKEAKENPSWFCIHRENRHEVGCPHKEWTVEQLREALINSKASNIALAKNPI
jgi:hypothetical protein